MKKRLLSMVLAMAMVLSLLTTGVYATGTTTISVGETVTVTISENPGYAELYFTPEESGTYRFYSTSDDDTYGYLYLLDGDSYEYLTDDDDSGSGTNYSIDYECEAGTTYIIRSRFYYSSTTGSFDVSVIVSPATISESYTYYSDGVTVETYTYTYDDGDGYIESESWIYYQDGSLKAYSYSYTSSSGYSGSDTYTYDSDGNLTSWTSNYGGDGYVSSVTEYYTYDSNGNLTNVTGSGYSYDEDEDYGCDLTYTYTEEYTYYSNGNLCTYEYNYENSDGDYTYLIEVYNEDGSEQYWREEWSYDGEEVIWLDLYSTDEDGNDVTTSIWQNTNGTGDVYVYTNGYLTDSYTCDHSYKVTNTSGYEYTATCSVCGYFYTDTCVFTDVKTSQYYYSSVLWALSNGITAGTSTTTFSPSQSCTRAQIVTFLWRMAGCPEPTTTNNPFTDVKSNAYYYKAVLWAVEQGITAGTSATTFSPTRACTRAEAVTFLYRYAGSPSVSSTSKFTDVKSSAYYASAVAWAVENGITAGTSSTKFSPTTTCNRAMIVCFLYRYDSTL